MRLRKPLVLGTLLLLGAAAGCADLEVTNPNDPARKTALATPGDLQSLVAGSFHTWYEMGHRDGGSPAFWMGNASFEYSSWPANFAEVDYSSIPRTPLVNDPSAGDRYAYISYPWSQSYKALASIHDGLQGIADPDVAAELGPDEVLKTKAFAKFVQGVVHGSLALFYDQAFFLDETVETTDGSGAPIILEPIPYTELMQKALGELDEAIAMSSGADFSIDADWISTPTSASELAQIAHDFKARFRAEVARTPEERAAVDWQAVLDDLAAGVDIDDGWTMDVAANFSSKWRNEFLQYVPEAAWSQTSYFMVGMADQSGNYQMWLAEPPGERSHDLSNGEPFMIVTPDTRFPRGTTLEEQEAAPGTLYEIPTTSETNPYSFGNNWRHPERGTFRWSYYRTSEFDQWDYYGGDPPPEFAPANLRMLKAEALYRLGDKAGAAELINVTRTAAGLNATDAAGTNTSCVPKLPDGSCGDLFEMLKWEKRIEGAFKGLFGVPWYFDGRGWGDLYKGTSLSLPLPCRDAQTLGVGCYTFGGDGDASAAVSSYAFPGEG